jgi:hypothetical protein
MDQRSCSVFFGTKSVGGHVVWIVLCLSIFLVLAVPPSHASMTCKRIEQLPSVSDSQIAEKIATFARTSFPSQTLDISSLDRRHYILRPRDNNCRSSSCYYHLVPLNDGAPIDVFSFRGTGIIWVILSPINMYFDAFNDRYSIVAVETANKGLINIALPLERNAVVIETLSDEETNILKCRIPDN